MVDEPAHPLDEGALRALVPRVLAGLVRRGEDFDAAEDALQEALLEALRTWPEHPPRDPRAWLTTVATRRLVDARRSEAARQRREEATYAEPQTDLHGGRRRHPLRALLLLPPRPRARLPGGADAARRRRTHDQGDRRRLLRAGSDDGATDQPGEAGPARTPPGPARRPRRRAARALPRLHHGPRGPRRPGRRGDPAGPPAHPRHRRTGGARTARADAPQPRPSPGATRRAGSDRHPRPAGPHLWDTREIAEGVRVLQSALASSAPAATRSRPPSPLCTTTRRAPRRPTGRRSSPGTTTSSSSPTTRCARTLPRCSAARWRSATSSDLPPGCARPTGCAACSASGSAGTPSAATCTSWAATSRPPAAAYAEAARRATNVAERDHLVRRAARARAAETARQRTPLRDPRVRRSVHVRVRSV